jgi:hypothetical protein
LLHTILGLEYLNFYFSDKPNQFFFFVLLLELAPLESLEEVESEVEDEEESEAQDVEKLGFEKDRSVPMPPTRIFPDDLATTPRDEMPRSGQ